MVIKEWKCAQHGPFECSDPICPAAGCRSQNVEREFRTPPRVRSGMMKQHDRGIRELSDRMGGVNFRSAQPDQASYGGHAAGGMKWGKDAESFLGHSLADNLQATGAMQSDAGVATRQDFVKRDLKPPFEQARAMFSDKEDRKRVVAS